MEAGANDFRHFSDEHPLASSAPWILKKDDPHDEPEELPDDAGGDLEEFDDGEMDECEDVGTHGPDEPPPPKKRGGSKRR